MNEEPFGLLAVISPFSTFAEVVTEANRSGALSGTGYDASPAEKLGQRWRVAHISTGSTATTGKSSLMFSENGNGSSST
jgi:acyl-CoA reductase-like NAD-dependent aldehyde dehydrogenase